MTNGPDKLDINRMSDRPEDHTTAEQKTERKIDRRGVLREFARTGKYAAPVATVLLLGSKDAIAMSDE